MPRRLLIPLGLLLLALILIGCQDVAGPSPDRASSVYAAADIFGIYPAIHLEKSTEGQDADKEPGPSLTPGTSVTWTYTVSNVGTVDLTGIQVWDDVEGSICGIAELLVGASQTCEKTGIVLPGPYANLGFVFGEGASFFGVTSVYAEDRSHYTGVAATGVTAQVDVKPGSDSNCLNPSSKGRLPVAILGSDSFDALDVDPATILAGGLVSPVRWGRGEDTNQDGFQDLVVHFLTPHLQFQGLLEDGADLWISGDLLSGGSFAGSDQVHIAGGPFCD